MPVRTEKCFQQSLPRQAIGLYGLCTQKSDANRSEGG